MFLQAFRQGPVVSRLALASRGVGSISYRGYRTAILASSPRASAANEDQQTQHTNTGPNPERPNPRRAEDMHVEPKGLPKGKLFLLATLASSMAYSYYTYDEKKFQELGITVAQEDPKMTIQKLFGFWFLNAAKIRRSFREFYLYFSEPPKPLLLPALEMPPNSIAPLTVVLDLDETLVHTEWDRTHGARTRRRPYVREFLQRLAQSGAEIVIFSSASMFYTDGIVAALDPKGQFIHHRLGKEYTTYQDGKYIKDLSRLNRDLSRVIILDDNPESYSLHPQNAVPIAKWVGDKSDTALRDLTPFFEYMCQGIGNSIGDVRAELLKYQGENIPELFRQKAEERAKKQQKIATLFGGKSLLNRPSQLQQQQQQQAPQQQAAQQQPQQQKPQQQQEQNAAAESKEQGSLWKWLQRKNEETQIREQQKQEEWALRQMEKSKKN